MGVEASKNTTRTQDTRRVSGNATSAPAAKQTLGSSTSPAQAQTSAHPAPTMNRNEPVRASAAQRELARARASHDPVAAQLQHQVQGGSSSSATSPGANLGTQTVNIRSGGAQARRDLIAQVPQDNDVSRVAGNAQANCSGAAAANALILTDKNGENARALRNAASRQNIQLSDPERRALDHFERGNLSPTDVAHLHQVAYRTGAAWDGQPNPPAQRVTAAGIETGARLAGRPLSAGEQRAVSSLRDMERRTAAGGAAGEFPPDQIADLQSAAAAAGYPADAPVGGAPTIRPNGVANLAAALRREGGFAEADGPVRFHQFNARGADGDYSHWTVSVGDTHVNSMPGSDGRAQVSTTGTPADARRSSDRFQSEVSVETTPGGTPVVNMDTAIPGNTTEVNRSQLRPEHGYRPAPGYLNRTAPRDRAVEQRAQETLRQLTAGPSDAWDADDRTVQALRDNPQLLEYATAEQRRWMARAVGTDDYWNGEGEQWAQGQIFQADQRFARDETPSLYQ